MVDISKINTNNKINLPQKSTAKVEQKAPEQVSSGANGVYPSGDLLRSMFGVQPQQSSKPSQNSQTQQKALIIRKLFLVKIQKKLINIYTRSRLSEKSFRLLNRTKRAFLPSKDLLMQ